MQEPATMRIPVKRLKLENQNDNLRKVNVSNELHDLVAFVCKYKLSTQTNTTHSNVADTCHVIQAEGTTPPAMNVMMINAFTSAHEVVRNR